MASFTAGFVFGILVAFLFVTALLVIEKIRYTDKNEKEEIPVYEGDVLDKNGNKIA